MTKPALLIALATLALTGCGELFGRSINQPSGIVANQLYRMPPGADLMRVPEMIPGARMRVESLEEKVVWTYSLRGKDVCRFTAHVSPSGDSISTVWTELDQLGRDDTRYLCIATEIAGKESVAATLDGRDADAKKVEGELMAAMVGNMDLVFKGIGEQLNNRTDGMDEICNRASTTAGMQSCRDGTAFRNPDRRRN